MKKISSENRKKLTSVLASVIWASVVLTGCPQPQIKVEPEQKAWPETILDSEKDDVLGLSTATLADSINSMSKIIEILTAHKDDIGVKEYLTVLTQVRDALNKDDVKALANKVSPEAKIEKLSKLSKETKLAKFDNVIEIDDTNKDIFPELYADAVAAKNAYNTYRDGEYATRYNTYEGAYTTYEGAYNTYDSAYTTYDGAYNTYKDALTLATPKYAALEKFAKDVVDDFRDNYVFNGNYTKEQVDGLIAAAKAENVSPEIQETYNAAKESFNNGAVATYNTAKGVFENAGATYATAKTSYENSTEKGEVESKYNTAVEKKALYENGNVKTFKLGESFDGVADADVIMLTVPNDATSVDVFKFVEAYESIKESAKEGAEIHVGYKNLPFNIDFAAKETEGKSNTRVLDEYYGKYNRDKITSADEGKPVETEIIPGVSVVTFTDYFGTGTYPEVVLNALKVSRATTLKMPSEYSLTGTYKSGVIGDGVNVTLENSANAKVSGEVLGYLNFTSVYDLFVENTDPSALPMIGSNNDKVIFRVSDLDREPYNDGSYDANNLYGSNVDKIIEKYYTNNKGSKLSLDLPSETKFDARAYLNGKMYSGNNYQDNAYPLDINAALIMANARVNNINNVNLIGEKNTELNSLEYLTNVRVSANMSGISITRVSGVVEFMDDAPSRISGTESFTVFKKVSNDMVIGGLGYVDAMDLNQTAANHFKPEGTNYSVRKFAKQGSVTFPSSQAGETGGNVTSVEALPMTKEEVEQIGVTGGYLSKTLPNNAKPASKVDLMRNILEDTQKQYS